MNKKILKYLIEQAKNLEKGTNSYYTSSYFLKGNQSLIFEQKSLFELHIKNKLQYFIKCRRRIKGFLIKKGR